jgi:hypothetical protein
VASWTIPHIEPPFDIGILLRMIEQSHEQRTQFTSPYAAPLVLALRAHRTTIR